MDELGIGWDISLEKPELWLNAIETCVNMDDESYKKMSERSRKFAVEWLSDTSHEDSYRKMFDLFLVGDDTLGIAGIWLNLFVSLRKMKELEGKKYSPDGRDGFAWQNAG